MKKNQWRGLRYDLTALVDEQGVVLAKVYQTAEQIWRYKDMEFVDRWSAMKYVEKLKSYDNGSVGRKDDGGGHIDNGSMGIKKSNRTKNPSRAKRAVPLGDGGGCGSDDGLVEGSEELGFGENPF